MKSRSEVWLRSLQDLGEQCSVSTPRDAETLARRVAQEGESFFTITLPRYGKDLERALDRGGISPDLFRGFGRRKSNVTLHVSGRPALRLKRPGGIPKFLGGFLDLVFTDAQEVHTSLPLEEVPDRFFEPILRSFENAEQIRRAARAVAAVRQLTLMFGKEKELCSDSVNEAAIAQYVETDKELDRPLKDERAALLFEGGMLDRLRKIVRLMFGDSLSFVDREIYDRTLTPGHGPGATSDYLYGNQKWTFPTWTERLEELFPFVEFATPGFRYSWKYRQVRLLKPEEEQPARQVLVPKTQTAPRVISIEPTCMQYIQQAIARKLVFYLERDHYSKWFIGFTDQVPNQELALVGSVDRSLATLDLSEASDRVANWLVEDLFADFPWFLEGIQACRSRTVQLASGDIITLQKFASMGSALTFPIEAMVFTAIAVDSVLQAAGLPLSRRSIMSLRGMVRVYGDDIIVPAHFAETVIRNLETFGFKVNRHKSFWVGNFRESCGKEYWMGEDVSIVRFRTKVPASRRDATEVVSTVSTRNQLYKAGLWRTVGLLDGVLDNVLNGHYPVVAETSSVLGKVNPGHGYDIHGHDVDLHTPWVRGYVVKSKIPVNAIFDDTALMKCLVESIGMPNADVEHLTRSGRPKAVSIKLSKARPY